MIKEGLIKLKNNGFFHIFSADVINKILSFVASFVVVRLISKPEYGSYSSAQNILNILILFSGLGMVSGTLQLCSEKHEDENISHDIYSYGCRVGTAFNAVMSVAIILVALFVKLPVPGENKYLAMLAAFPIINLINDLQRISFRYRLDNKGFARANVIWTVFYVTLGVIGAFIWQASGLIFGHYIGGIIAIVLTRMFLGGGFNLRKTEISQENKRALLKISTISMFNNGLSNLLYLLDIFIIGLVMTDEVVVASYKVATLIPTALNFIPAAVVTYVYPYFARNKDDKEWTKKNYNTLFKIGLAGNGALSAFLVIFAPLIIKLCFGAQYLDAVPAFRLLSISYFFVATFRTISGNLLVSQRKLTFNLIINIISGLVNIVSNYFLILHYGAIGAAITTLTITSVFGIISTIYYRKVISNIPE